MRRPQMVNQDGEKCIMVLKNGGATTLKMAPASSPKDGRSLQKTTGLAPSLPQATRARSLSMAADAWAVYLRAVAALWRILTYTYATPISFVLERLEASGFKANFKLPFVA